jgi:nitrogen-specific signal transduction histidine kinase
MSEKYTEPVGTGAEATFSAPAVRELLGRLLPTADGGLILSALQAEISDESAAVPSMLDAEAGPDARELARVRRVYLAGESARAVHHAMSNTLTALQTEAQLLELEPLAEEHRRASTRIVELTRRLATVMRRLDPGVSSRRPA